MRTLVVIQTEAENRATCGVEISLELIASLVTGAPARMPTLPMAAAVMLILKNQNCVFAFVPVAVAVCFRYVNLAGQLYRLHAA
ncbi:hypothetical protein [Mesorhizobium sp. B263B2A]|uniref:hypothetical protein n=1 Tax=Mesorhizobium sp. B263B2A TaxID=2876669 RepID=UPI001CD189DC|nr:hypothetical protein [Mesorhizobium sp. B263B2A]MCA0031147.1 hypothetical protein [Mesorhizobium sp. B263B2A]